MKPRPRRRERRRRGRRGVLRAVVSGRRRCTGKKRRSNKVCVHTTTVWMFL